MAVPKRRQSKTRGRKRRAHDGITLANPSSCPNCGEPKMPAPGLPLLRAVQ